MGDVVKLGGSTKHRIEPDRILNAHIGELSDVLLIGIEKGTGRFIVAVSNNDLERAVFLANKFSHKAVGGDYGNPTEGLELSGG